jgi:hypothetical protein
LEVIYAKDEDIKALRRQDPHGMMSNAQHLRLATFDAVLREVELIEDERIREVLETLIHLTRRA